MAPRNHAACVDGYCNAVLSARSLPRLLAQFGALPDLDRCCECGHELALAYRGEVTGGLACRRHAASPRRTISAEALQLLRNLRDRPGRSWPRLAQVPLSAAHAALPALWLASALECRSPLRARLFVTAAHRSSPPTRNATNGRQPPFCTALPTSVTAP